MNIQQKKEMLIELGTFVDKNWLDEQFEWCMMRIKKNMVRFGLDFPSACATNGKYRIKKMMIGQMVFGRECFGYLMNGQKKRNF